MDFCWHLVDIGKLLLDTGRWITTSVTPEGQVGSSTVKSMEGKRLPKQPSLKRLKTRKHTSRKIQNVGSWGSTDPFRPIFFWEGLC